MPTAHLHRDVEDSLLLVWTLSTAQSATGWMVVPVVGARPVIRHLVWTCPAGLIIIFLWNPI